MGSLWTPSDGPVDIEKMRSVGKLREGYKTSTRKWRHKWDPTRSYQTDHWDGRLDAHIFPDAVRLGAQMAQRKEETWEQQGPVRVSKRAMRMLRGGNVKTR